MGIFDKMFKKNQQPMKKEPPKPLENPYAPMSALPQEANHPEEPQQPKVVIPETYEGKQVAYRYPDVKLTPAGVPLARITPTTRLTLTDDGDQIKAMLDDIYIGSLPQNRLSGMVRDWDKNGDPYISYISSYNDDGSEVEILLVFYADLIGRYLQRNSGAKLIKLTGKPDEFACPTVGGECEVEYDYEKEKYYVSYNADMIGWLPASAIKYAEDHGLEPNEMDVIIADVDFDYEKDRDIISVYISD